MPPSGASTTRSVVPLVYLVEFVVRWFVRLRGVRGAVSFVFAVLFPIGGGAAAAAFFVSWDDLSGFVCSDLLLLGWC